MIPEIEDAASRQRILTELEALRKEIYGIKIKNYSIIGIAVLIIILGIVFKELILAILLGIPILIYGFVMHSKAGPKETQYRYSYKHALLAYALRAIDDSLKIDDLQALSEEAFISSRLFAKAPERYQSEDQVYGFAGKTKFSFSEVHAEYKTVTQTKNGQRVDWHDILKGIVFSADFNKNFNGTTMVRPKDFSAVFGAWISTALPIFASGEVVKLENPDFDKNFITYSNDQVEARYILTPSMMERISELNKRSQDTISLSFTGSLVYIAFPLNGNYFEPSFSMSLLDENLLQKDIELVEFMYGIVNELDLNTRIWGKN
ncbi:Protein of unknown function [Pedobacter steynii]|uniref:Galanin n=1 Tax=Pedobacter steynii TaxID=430522 RepID=A0A1H0M7V8_9SPHI|nr:DUF3137 domain-containing protein [Pedobacter steynii]NQX43606.1 DUF3137 domain-containing protein [Pedobacter steynii]SDO76568.1 Protein of unknown function [Pedobacter steynii]